ncbi:hypothetical protein JVT61DRAFT_7849 [Boletus reticuloceps]|uniref:Myb/SANT-like domain-containing protein n=1 Tax=Boletus reticuloceps TaxID=495285 RepID=A0A8I2YHW5_9AGAM|nr:hypothetical protein JVT61DRAFT_7849 [Boletus reticuloceps]
MLSLSIDSYPGDTIYLTHWHILKTFFELITSIGHFSVDLMADQVGAQVMPGGFSDKAKWTPIKVTHFVSYLHEHRDECGDNGSFKEATYNAAAAHIGPYFNGIGCVKTGKMVASKWSSLKTIYNAIKSYRIHRSGLGWDNENSAGIQGVDAANVWDTYIERKTNAAMEPF